MRFRRPRRWADLSRLERVDLYTRQSLHLVLWLMCLFVLAAVPSREPLLWAGGLVVTALGSSLMNAVVRGYPRIRPFAWRRAAALALACVLYLGLVAVPGQGQVAGTAGVLVAANLAAALGGLPDHRISLGVVLFCTVVVGATSANLAAAVSGVVIGVLVVFTVRVSLWLYGVVSELDEARQTQARLAVAEERLRFSRDVHDVLGRRLSTIAVQAELAATLARRGDSRAADRMMDVRQVAHDSLAEARELARGYRPTNLSQELEGARSLLRSAGIDVGLDIGDVPRAWHEAAGWVVRESVTNVLRHSSATVVRISYRDGELRVENDGVGTSVGTVDGTGAAAGTGSGLRGLGERLAPLGAGVRAGPSGPGRNGWTLVARFPASGPVSASAAPAAPARTVTPDPVDPAETAARARRSAS
ncbi:hypothetical protein KIH74_30425 [Kineosporia sp. J2-2]|uniref:Signal transduction histidine kinase subgroup 3 dimerisation and phosphoacceptor domain-containing protein n=1 Tax=Kineosporia corallincola TaxID=2835133 RepID=A0ABS5TQB7_9ACTN|nr:histidine kinase [Kineosporia corallincola]MBT0773300.1 hypothetical protein [Kineosporia corallincola]